MRDGAVLALVAAGLTAEEICELRASSITSVRGRLLVKIRRYGLTWFVVLSPTLGGRLLVWLSECRLWAVAEPVFAGPQGQLCPMAIHQIYHRYSRQGRTA